MRACVCCYTTVRSCCRGRPGLPPQILGRELCGSLFIFSENINEARDTEGGRDFAVLSPPGSARMSHLDPPPRSPLIPRWLLIRK